MKTSSWLFMRLLAAGAIMASISQAQAWTGGRQNMSATGQPISQGSDKKRWQPQTEDYRMEMPRSYTSNPRERSTYSAPGAALQALQNLQKTSTAPTATSPSSPLPRMRIPGTGEIPRMKALAPATIGTKIPTPADILPNATLPVKGMTPVSRTAGAVANGLTQGLKAAMRSGDMNVANTSTNNSPATATAKISPSFNINPVNNVTQTASPSMLLDQSGKAPIGVQAAAPVAAGVPGVPGQTAAGQSADSGGLGQLAGDMVVAGVAKGIGDGVAGAVAPAVKQGSSSLLDKVISWGAKILPFFF